jgi:MoaA/NifB/PqqE/SkfB family radical SAM enzyme
MVFTGGDPLKRPDLFLLLRRSVALGLRTNVSPSATPLLTRAVVREFKECGVVRMAISLDGPHATSHDAFRGVPHTFDCAVEALEEARDIGLDKQIQTTVTRRNMHRLDEIAAVVAKMKARMWSVFFLVVTGRALVGDDLTGEEYEQVFEKLHEISKWAPFEIKTTEAMHYRRYLARHREEPEQPDSQRTVWRTAGVSDGRGFVFVSHTGEVFQVGFYRSVPATCAPDRDRHLSQLGSVPDASRRRCPSRQMRDLRIPQAVRRFEVACYALTGNYLAALLSKTDLTGVDREPSYN